MIKFKQDETYYVTSFKESTSFLIVQFLDIKKKTETAVKEKQIFMLNIVMYYIYDTRYQQDTFSNFITLICNALFCRVNGQISTLVPYKNIIVQEYSLVDASNRLIKVISKYALHNSYSHNVCTKDS